MGDRGALALGANAFPRLRSLYLGQNDIGDGGAYALARAEMPKMRNLYLSGNGISDEGATELAASSLMGHLRQLDLRRNPIGAAGQAALKERAAQHKALTLHVDDPPYVAADPQAAEPPSMSGRLLSRLVNLLDQ